MSTGKRLAKRSIIGTRVCAPGPDGLWYSGVIQDVKTPPQKGTIIENNNCINLTPDTKYTVRFDFKTQSFIDNNSQVDGEDAIMMDTTQIGNIVHHHQQQQQHRIQQQQQQHNLQIQRLHHQHPQHHHHQQQHQIYHHYPHHHTTTAIQSRPDIMLSPAQSVRRKTMIKEFRESELIGPGFRTIMGVQLHPGQRIFLTYNGRETSGDVISHNIQKDEVLVKITPIGYEEPLELKKRLEEVRLLESRRSARLADQERDTDFARLADMAGDRRRTSHSIDVPLALTHNSRKRRPSYSQDERDNFLTQFRDDDQMDACNAALVLMSLSCSPRSPSTGQWNTVLGSSPGSSSASWSSSGTSSPPLSDDGTPPNGDTSSSNSVVGRTTNIRIRTTSLSTSDEGIVMDYSDDAPRKRRAHGPIFQCTWKGCGITEVTVAKIEAHVRNAHLGPKKPRHSFDDDGAFSDSDHEEEFYYTEIEDDEDKAPSPPSPPTLSHRDMARPPHEDPEYQRQIVGNFRQGLLALSQSNTSKSVPHSINNAGPINIPTSPLAHHNYTWSSPMSPVKHARWSPRPSTSSAPYPSPTYIHHHYNNNTNSNNHQHHLHQQPQQPQQIQQQGGLTIQNAANMTTLSHSAPSSTTNLTAAIVNATTATVVSPNIQHHHQQQQQQQQTPPHTHGAQHLPTPQPQPQLQSQPQPQPQHHIQPTVQQAPITTTAAVTAAATTNHRSPQSPNRRTRGDNKKCRKVYGMDHKDQWCTQCKWKKACSRFGD